MLTTFPGDGCGHESGKGRASSLIDEIVREGAPRMLAEALEVEMDALHCPVRPRRVRVRSRRQPANLLACAEESFSVAKRRSNV